MHCAYWRIPGHSKSPITQQRLSTLSTLLSYMKQVPCMSKTSRPSSMALALYECPCSFISCREKLTKALQVETNMPPTSLLQLIKSIEQRVGRLPSIQNGPRAIDLDIIFYDNQVVDADDMLGRNLIIPHARMQEREFVLRPLNELVSTLIFIRRAPYIQLA